MHTRRHRTRATKKKQGGDSVRTGKQASAGNKPITMLPSKDRRNSTECTDTGPCGEPRATHRMCPAPITAQRVKLLYRTQSRSIKEYRARAIKTSYQTTPQKKKKKDNAKSKEPTARDGRPGQTVRAKSIGHMRRYTIIRRLAHPSAQTSQKQLQVPKGMPTGPA